jgi:hypothetical protein
LPLFFLGFFTSLLPFRLSPFPIGCPFILIGAAAGGDPMHSIGHLAAKM